MKKDLDEALGIQRLIWGPEIKEDSCSGCLCNGCMILDCSVCGECLEVIVTHCTIHKKSKSKGG